jgi:hypothetical protein
MTHAFRSPLLPVFLLLALFWPLPGRTAPIGVSIALTNVLFVYDPDHKNLSAEAAPIGGLPALPLLNNGRYTDTAAGDFAVTVNLPPLDEPHVWLISDDLSIDGRHAFGGKDVFGPISVEGALDEALGRLSPGLRGIVKAIGERVLTKPQDGVFGLFDWSYNRNPADDLTGTFALGSTVDLAKLILGESVIPGEFLLSLSISAFAIDIPEPVTVLIIAPALLGLAALRRRTAHQVANAL